MRSEAGSLSLLTVRYLAQRSAQRELVPVTVQGYRSALDALARVHGGRPVGQMGRSTIERWLVDRGRLKPSTRRTQWSVVSGFLDWLVDRGTITANPCRSMRAPRRPRSTPRALDRSAVVASLGEAPDARTRAVLWLEVGLGLRRVEVHRLNVEDWSRRDATLRVVGKGSHEREIPVTAPVARALAAYLAAHPATSGALVRSYTTGRRLGLTSLSRMVAKVMYAAGVKIGPRDGISGHALRHTAASDVLDRCGDLRVVQEMLGHVNLSSTAIYLRRSRLGEIRDAMEGREYGEDDEAA